MPNFSIPLTPALDWQTDLLSKANPNGGGPAGQLSPGGSIYSPQQAFRLTLQSTDGNLVLETIDDSALPSISWVPIWSIFTNMGIPSPIDPSSLTNQLSDGNIVLSDTLGAAKWSTGTQGDMGAFLRVQDDGNVVVYSAAGTAVWATNTAAGPAGRNKAGLLN